MPHLMPMMWTLTFIISLTILFITMSTIYFFYLPIPLKNLFIKKNKLNWIWKW